METRHSLNPRALQRTSRQAALLSAFGAVVVFSALGYSTWKMSALQESVKTKQAELDSLEHRKADTQEEIASLEKQLEVLRQEKERLGSALRSISETVEKSSGATLYSSVKKLTPVAAEVRPMAEAVPLQDVKGPRGEKLYEFSLWLSAPPQRLASIARVSYEFNHPTFRQKDLSSSDASSAFRVGYRGWGCLSRVIVTVTLKDGSTSKLDFDMCEALRRKTSVPMK